MADRGTDGCEVYRGVVAGGVGARGPWKMESVEFWNPTPETVEAEVLDQNKEVFRA
jgi:hypothetical protein